MAITLAEAAAQTGKSKSAIFRSVRAGRLAAARDELSRAWMIEPAELFRLYPPKTEARAASAPRARAKKTAEIELLRELLSEREATIADLRNRLDSESAERREALRKLTALLDAPAPARRGWLWWLRRSARR